MITRCENSTCRSNNLVGLGWLDQPSTQLDRGNKANDVQNIDDAAHDRNDLISRVVSSSVIERVLRGKSSSEHLRTHRIRRGQLNQLRNAS